MKSKCTTNIISILTCLTFAIFVVPGLQARTASQTAQNVAVQILGTDSQSGPQIFADGMVIPWSIDFLPDKNMLVTERGTNAGGSAVSVLSPSGQLIRKESFSGEIGQSIAEGGLLGVAVHPQYAQNGFVYFYATYNSGGSFINRIIRWRLHPSHPDLVFEPTLIVNNIPGSGIHNGGRLKFGPDGFLYATTGDAGNPALAQDMTSLAGKILRIDVNQPNPSDPSSLIYSYGHRNPQGLTWDNSGQLWSTEHGPSGQDEMNLIVPGGNYGWPDSVGDIVQAGTIAPVLHSGIDVTWAPASAAHYNGYIFFGGLGYSNSYARSLYRYEIATGTLDKYYTNIFGRVRETAIGPMQADGKQLLYFTTSNTSSSTPLDRVLKVDPDELGLACGPYPSSTNDSVFPVAVWFC